MTRGRDRGAVTVEFVLLVPVLALLTAVVIAGARVWWAKTSVQQLAASAARQASIARTASEATSDAQRLVDSDLATTGVHCQGGATLTLDLRAFALPVGQPGTVAATVRCAVPLSDVLIVNLGGTFVVDASATSTLDRFRARRVP